MVLIDGSTLLMRPWRDLVEHYGLHRNQHGVSYWAIMRVVVAFCLHSGGLRWVQEGPLSESEQSLAQMVVAQGTPNSVFVADRNFGVFSVAQAARHYGQQVLLRLPAQPYGAWPSAPCTRTMICRCSGRPADTTTTTKPCR